jgi:hypothetical protein
MCVLLSSRMICDAAGVDVGEALLKLEPQIGRASDVIRCVLDYVTPHFPYTSTHGSSNTNSFAL